MPHAASSETTWLKAPPNNAPPPMATCRCDATAELTSSPLHATSSETKRRSCDANVIPFMRQTWNGESMSRTKRAPHVITCPNLRQHQVSQCARRINMRPRARARRINMSCQVRSFQGQLSAARSPAADSCHVLSGPLVPRPTLALAVAALLLVIPPPLLRRHISFTLGLWRRLWRKLGRRRRRSRNRRPRALLRGWHRLGLHGCLRQHRRLRQRLWCRLRHL